MKQTHGRLMRTTRVRQAVTGLGLLAALGATISGPVWAEMSAEELAKLAQNPVGNLISLPFQNNTNLNFGPEKGTQKALWDPSRL